MKANTNGIFARLYRYFYNVKVMPVSPYKYGFNMLIALLCIIPATILVLPAYIVEVIWYAFDRTMKWATSLRERILVTLSIIGIILFFVAIVLSIMSPFTTLPNVFWDIIRLIGNIINGIFCIGIIYGICYGIKWCVNKIVNKTPEIDWDDN